MSDMGLKCVMCGLTLINGFVSFCPNCQALIQGQKGNE